MSSEETTKKVIKEWVEKSNPTGHLPKVPESDPGASVPTGHLPNDVTPAPTPASKPQDDKKD